MTLFLLILLLTLHKALCLLWFLLDFPFQQPHKDLPQLCAGNIFERSSQTFVLLGFCAQ